MARTSSPRRAKSAGRMGGAMRMAAMDGCLSAPSKPSQACREESVHAAPVLPVAGKGAKMAVADHFGRNLLRRDRDRLDPTGGHLTGDSLRAFLGFQRADAI